MNRFLIALLVFASSAVLALGQVVPNTYLLELDGSQPALESFRSGRHRIARAEFASAQKRVRDGQVRTIRSLQNRGGRLIHQYDSIVNGLLVEMSDAKASQLASLPGVKSVRPVHEMKLLLDRALPMHKIPEAWNNLPGGPDSAGAGIKVGVIDTGVDVRHPAFADDTRPALEGYPKFGALNEEIDKPLINSKIVVMRSYENLVDRFAGTRLTATDGVGHGTGVAMAAVGKRIAGPHGPISGVAPAAYLGVYRIIGASGGSNDAAILAALEDAVKDGMDVVNLSVGNTFSPDDSNDAALQRVADAGVIFVVSIGNQGPGLQSTAWPGSSPHAIGVGSSGNDRLISSRGVVLADGVSRAGFLGDASVGAGRFTATVKDAASLGNELACNPFPAGSLQGSIVLMLRGECNFEVKFDFAKAAGAIAAIVYNPTQVDAGLTMVQGFNHTPSIWLNNNEGLALKAQIGANADLMVTMDTMPATTSDRLSSFSAMGPSTGTMQIKPDLVATGDNFVTAAPVFCCSTWGDDAGYALGVGFVSIQGTSFSSPLVAGAAAVLKQSRPGLTQHQYRSLLTNSAKPLALSSLGRNAIPHEAGVGRLDLLAAQKANAAVWPTTLSFGGGGANRPAIQKNISLTNLGTETDTFTLSIEPIGDSARPTLSSETLSVDGLASVDLEVRFEGQDLRAGHHHGVIVIRGTKNDVESRIPYWYGVASNEAGSIALIQDPEFVVAGGTRVPFIFRVTDSSGQAMPEATPEIEIVTEGGRVDSVDPYILGNGLYRAVVRPGRAVGTYIFRIKAGSVSYLFGIVSE